jgi:tricorn protease
MMSTVRRLSTCVCLLLVLISTSALAGIDARLLRYPDVSETEITFVYAGDIWLVAKAGGTAHRLSTPLGEETFPRFSPDGSLVAFSGNYDGNQDIYIISTDGGIPERITHHPAGDRMLDWYPDGRSLLYASGMTSGKNRFNQLWQTSRDGGLPTRLPLPYGEFGSIAPDGKTLAYVPITRFFRTWKRYRGGSAPEIWLFDLKDHSAKNVTVNPANDGQPMWHGSTLYFLSDRDENKRANIWALDSKTGQSHAVTSFDEYDVSFPAMGPDELVFCNGSDLYLLDLETSQTRKIGIDVITDKATLKPHIEDVTDFITNADISPSGKRVVIEARGEIFTVPAEHGITRNLTRSSGVGERFPAWSPDGKHIAYFSDRSSEYELTIRAADGSGEERKLTTMGPGFRYSLYWSPDSNALVFVDQAMQINLYDLEKDKLTQIDKGLFMYQGGLNAFSVSWSADSRWVSYSRSLENRNTAIFLYDTTSGESHQATSGFYSDSNPAFDPEGKYLYLITGRSFGPSYGDLDNSWIYANTQKLAVISLRADVPSPLAPRNDIEELEEDEEDGDDEAEKDDDDTDDAKTKDEDEDEDVEPVEIDLDGFEGRLVLLPPKNGNYTDLQAVEGKLIYRRLPRTGSGGEDSPIVYFDLEEREEETVLGDADGFAVAAGGEKLLVVSGDSFAIIEPKADQKMEDKLDLSGLVMTVDPPAEWRQIFDDAWRLERDYFYDPAMHGVDWNALRTQYGSLLDAAVTRWDVNFIIGELIGELNASHAYRGGGDTETASRRGVGLLGVDFSLEHGAYRISQIIRGAEWDSAGRSPLAQPGVDAAEGDYLLAVNGVPLDTSKDPWAAFQGLADDTVMLTLNDKPKMEGAREVLVETMAREGGLRHKAWIENMRQKVDAATDGRVGYIYVADTGVNGQTQLMRMYRAQFDKQGLIIDERFNSGGQIPDRFIELLQRPISNYWGVRDGKDWQWPPTAHNGAKVMLINPWAGSGGDAFPFYFRQSGLGPLIGTRTWGGLIGYTGVPGLIDGGRVTVPTFGIYSNEGEWMIEGFGVAPDIEVIDDPSLMVDGGDPQLERAIQEVLDMIKRQPPVVPDKPDYPARGN